jgi:hypothetical protein
MQFRVHCDRRSCQHCPNFQDIKAKSVEGTKAQVRSDGAKVEQQQYDCEMETVYIKKEADDDITTAEPLADTEDTRESRSVIFGLILNTFIAVKLMLVVCHALK